MDVQHAIALLDAALQSEPQVHDVQKAHTENDGIWMQDNYRADVRAAGSTGLELRLSAHGRIMHERIFASSPASVPRMARAIVEHLTGYAN